MWNAFGVLNRQVRLHKVKQQANAALTIKHSAKVIELVLSWLYSLRNQIIHGGATWNSQVNRSQLNDGVNLMSKRVPFITKVMMVNLQAF